MPGSTKVVDSWAMIAWVKDEAAAPSVEIFLQDADSGKIELLMSWINVAETFYILAKRNSPAIADQFLARLPSLPIRIVLQDEEGIMAAARIKASHPRKLVWDHIARHCGARHRLPSATRLPSHSQSPKEPALSRATAKSAVALSCPWTGSAPNPNALPTIHHCPPAILKA